MKGFALLVALLPLAASAATITVNTNADNTTAGNGTCTLREAIANVNAGAETTGGDCTAGSGGGDTIKFGLGMPAKIRLRLGQLEIHGDVNIVNPASARLHIDGFGKSRVFEITAGTTSMSGLTIERGSASTGGGVMVDQGATLTLIKSALDGNIAKFNDADPYVDEISGGGIFNAGTLILSDCTLSRNRAVDEADVAGGAIYNAGGVVTLTNCALTGNRGETGDSSESAGGGIHNAGGSVALDNCTLTRNVMYTANGWAAGGGLSNVEGTLTLANCTLVGNKAFTSPKQSAFIAGGSIYNESGTVVLSNSVLTRSAAISGGDSQSFGGGIFNEGSMMLSHCSVSRNLTLLVSGESFGGGIYNEGSMIVTSSTLSRNAALRSGAGSGAGGGIFSSDIYANIGDGPVTLDMNNCTVARNKTKSSPNDPYEDGSEGGGIYNSNQMTVTNCTLSGNTAGRPTDSNLGGGGIANQSDTVVVTNTIVANSGGAGDCSGLVPSGGHNLGSDGTCFSGGGTDRFNTNPRLGPLGNYGGQTETIALCTAAGAPATSCTGASPAIDAGDDSVTGPPDNFTTDQRGLPRLSGAHVDIGAYEAQ